MRLSLLSAFCLALLLCICLANPSYSDGNGCGDANGDALVNVGDAVFLINYIFREGPAPDPVCIGDANADGLTNVGDAVHIINYIWREGPAPDESCCESTCPETVTDIDGNVYQTIQIGDQCWMAENLKVIHYRNGNPIPNVTSDAVWADLTSGAYCNYNNDVNNVATYGRLYNWRAVDDGRGIAPAGWHVPSDTEWKQLEMYLGMSQAEADTTLWRGTDEGGKLKEIGTTHWNSPNTGATNESGFTALPGSYRYSSSWFGVIGRSTSFWSSTGNGYFRAWMRHLDYENSGINRYDSHKECGFSVRCVKD